MKEDNNLFLIPYAKPMKCSNHWSPQESKLVRAFGKGETKRPQALAESAVVRGFFR